MHNKKLLQVKLKNYFSPTDGIKEIIEFVTNQTGLSRYNLVNKLWYKKNIEVASLIFGFDSFQETILHAKSFFPCADFLFPKLSVENKKIYVKPLYLTKIEQILIIKSFMQSFPYYSNCSLLVGVSRQCVTCAIKKWTPM